MISRTPALGTAMGLALAFSLGVGFHCSSPVYAASKSSSAASPAAAGGSDARRPSKGNQPIKPAPRTKGKKLMKAKAEGPKTHTLPGGIICTETGTKSGVQGTLDCRPAPTSKK